MIDIFALGEKAWTVEDGGRIRHRNSAGVWTFQDLPKEVQDTLLRVHFLADGTHGWASGENGWLLTTDTGGLVWDILFRMPNPVDPTRFEDLYDVHFLDVNKGWLLGKHGIWRTSDGGSCWTPCTLLDENGVLIDPSTIELYALDLFQPGVCVRACGCPGGPSCPCPINPVFGLACAEPGLIFRTQLGSTWKQVFDMRDLCECNGGAGLNSTCEELHELCDADPLTPPPACETPVKFFEPWDIEIRRSSSSPLAIMFGGVMHQCGAAFASVEPLSEVEVISASNVWIGGQCGRIWQWNGSVWLEHKSQTDAHVWGMSFISATRGYVNGQRSSNTQSVIVKYKDGAQ